MAFVIYTPLLLFYPITSTTSNVSTRHHAMSIDEGCRHLIESLAKTLTHFYPLAGRIVKGNSIVKCNDDGAAFIKARISCCLSDILENPDGQILKRFLPIEIESKEAGTGWLLLVQVNFISHRIADASTLCTFINCWATIALGSSDSDQVLNLPEFGAASVFKPIEFSSSSQPPAREVVKEKCIAQRYVFDASKISTLQSEVASSFVAKPTRVEAVSALIWKSATEASRSNLRKQGPSFFRQDVNLRKRVVPPLPENLAGNVVGSFTSKADEESTAKLVFDSDEAWQEIKDKQNKPKTHDNMEIYSCTSWCRFPFYEADFGWGRPSWASVASIAIKNIVVLMDKRDCSGIEAWVTMSEESKALFESNMELLGYASVNPSVIDT
ncbi:BAHD acyltransferase [Pyrus ussuriensis x Pyrus communis]|uniref:BAHD acyltransferase n=1 Tax=Pyrus ussuriensis x Pyrus communis TaxID=2448454 RepID=A0A5N5IGU1_9ROSA|nr:BAHD acyltransferase [Pyrus ussuriensis x Pyrus communis]